MATKREITRNIAVAGRHAILARAQLMEAPDYVTDCLCRWIQETEKEQDYDSSDTIPVRVLCTPAGGSWR